ncbi:MAG: 4-hydroxyphenylpyruvate dioxygenase [Gaiellaceae bacterium]|nr:4-hydroxyphenylpyruvate dioxygenase [Gaiellaceae bacterium]
MAEHDFMPITGWDHVELWVGNAKQAAYFYEHAFGFTPTAYAGPETGVRDRASYLLEQGDIRLVLTSGLRADSEICQYAARHGDAVKDVAFAVPDATAAYRQAVQRGARGVAEPRSLEDEHGRVELASIATYGEVVHTFVDRSQYAGAYLPGYRPLLPEGERPGPGAGLRAIDHVVGNVELGRMDEWVAFYERVLGFSQLRHFSDEEISTEYSALMSKVLADGEGKIKLPINEPAEGRRRSQIEEYLEFHAGPGVQHIALLTDDIVSTVAWLREHGVLFISTPDTYYELVRERVGEIEEDWADIRRLGILADRDEEGYLLQLFTKIVQDRPTLFFEVIERHGSRGFGLGNFKALFEAIEREQALRGNL